MKLSTHVNVIVTVTTNNWDVNSALKREVDMAILAAVKSKLTDFSDLVLNQLHLKETKVLVTLGEGSR